MHGVGFGTEWARSPSSQFPEVLFSPKGPLILVVYTSLPGEGRVMSDYCRFPTTAIAQTISLSAVLRSAALLACAFFLPNLAWAGIGFQPVNPEELKMTSEPLAPGAPAIILYRQVDRVTMVAHRMKTTTSALRF